MISHKKKVMQVDPLIFYFIYLFILSIFFYYFILFYLFFIYFILFYLFFFFFCSQNVNSGIVLPVLHDKFARESLSLSLSLSLRSCTCACVRTYVGVAVT